MTETKKIKNPKVDLTMDELQGKKAKLENELLSFKMSLDSVHVKSVQSPTQLMREYRQLNRRLAIARKQKKQKA
jgi:predicted  nucleic acid-binding Zn-ribbon protein